MEVIVICELCLKTPCDKRCPNYVPPKARYYCSICEDGIYNGDVYVKNADGEIAHFECIDEMPLTDLIEWFGGDIKYMDYGYYE